MKKIQILFVALGIAALTACNSNKTESTTASSTPIDSTNVSGTAPATYGGNDPANDQRDSNRTNVNDTGTTANNVHNAGSAQPAN